MLEKIVNFIQRNQCNIYIKLANENLGDFGPLPITDYKKEKHPLNNEKMLIIYFPPQQVMVTFPAFSMISIQENMISNIEEIEQGLRVTMNNKNIYDFILKNKES